MIVCMHTCQRAHINPSISTCCRRVITALAIMSGWDINNQESELNRDSIVYAAVSKGLIGLGFVNRETWESQPMS